MLLVAFEITDQPEGGEIHARTDAAAWNAASPAEHRLAQALIAHVKRGLPRIFARAAINIGSIQNLPIDTPRLHPPKDPRRE